MSHYFHNYSTGTPLDTLSFPGTDLKLELFGVGMYESSILLILSKADKEVDRYKGKIESRFSGMVTKLIFDVPVVVVCDPIGNNWFGYVDVPKNKIEELPPANRSPQAEAFKGVSFESLKRDLVDGCYSQR
jgi:hypothetical protein